MSSDQIFLTASVEGDVGPPDDCLCPIVPWWSFTKTVLATATLRLCEQGLVSLDDPIAGHPYTVRQLLQHTSGLVDYGSLPQYHKAVHRGDKPWSVKYLLEQSNVDTLLFPSGSSWCYSNTGYLFVRQIVEKITGLDLQSALEELVFNVIGLRGVQLAATPQDLAETAWKNHQAYNPGWVYHGLLIGTPDAAVYFLHKLMSGAILTAGSLEQMTMDHQIGGPLAGRPWLTTGYGLGLMIGQVEQAGLVLGHSGVGPHDVSAVYHIKGRRGPITVSSFSLGNDEGKNEKNLMQVALSNSQKT